MMNGQYEINRWIKSKSFFVTGASGSLGTRLVRRLSTASPKRVVAFARQPVSSRERGFALPGVENKAGSILCDSDLDQALLDCDVVFHLAGLVNVACSASDPASYFESNTLGSIRTFDACRRNGVSRVIYTSTGYVYGIPKNSPISEDHPTAPLSPYAASKLAGEYALHGFCSGQSMVGRIARISNIYGASNLTSNVTGSSISQALLQQGEIKLRNLASVRDFIHADDVVEALLLFAAVDIQSTECATVNISTGKGVSTGTVAEMIASLTESIGYARPQVTQQTSKTEEEISAVILDNSEVTRLTGWRPMIDLKTGLQSTMREFWFAGGTEDRGR